MTTQTPGYGIANAERPLWVGQTPAAWGDVVRGVDPEEAHDAASMIAAAGLDWTEALERVRVKLAEEADAELAAPGGE